MQLGISRYLCIVLLCFLISPVVGETLYKSTDEKGNIVFSDVPPNQESEEVDLQPINTMEAVKGKPAKTKPKPQQTPRYSISITNPTQDQQLRDNVGNVSISVTTQVPSWAQVPTVIILLDGKVVSEGSATQISVAHVDRGTHTISAQLKDHLGKKVATAQPVTFHLQRIAVVQ